MRAQHTRQYGCRAAYCSSAVFASTPACASRASPGAFVMTFVVTSNCHRCRYTDCVSVCPVECFQGDDEMLYIDPDVCIDCGACVSECPVEAIFAEGSRPDEEQAWLAINAERATRLPLVDTTQEPLPTAAAGARELGFKALRR